MIVLVKALTLSFATSHVLNFFEGTAMVPPNYGTTQVLPNTAFHNFDFIMLCLSEHCLWTIIITGMENETLVEIHEESADYFLGREILLKLRYYARHIIPCFCVVGIIGNCMALMLIRSAILQVLPSFF